MISIIKKYDAPPSILLKENRMEKLATILAAKDGDLYKSGDYAPKSVKNKLEEIYNEKCGYCESKIKHAAALQVEHYRPKAKVVGDKIHQGYYWLGMEWSNLLLACPNCNNQGAKGNRFPIQGNRVYYPILNLLQPTLKRDSLLANNLPLIAERPLLLNPELCNPRIHFYFDENAILYGKTDEGRETIDICKLNRKNLVGNRQEKQIILQNDFESILIGHRLNQFKNGGFEAFLRRTFKKLEDSMLPHNEYALWGWYMFTDFQKCFLAAIENPVEQQILLAAYKQYKKGTL